MKDLEARIDALYAGPLEAFVASRKELAAELKREHAKDAAARVLALPKPSAAAALVNRLHQKGSPAFAKAMAAGKRVRELFVRALGSSSADSAELGRAQKAHRDAIAEAIDELREESAGASLSGTTLARVDETLQAVTLTGRFGDGPEGRLVRELSPPGIEMLASIEPEPEAERAPGHERRTKKKEPAPAEEEEDDSAAEAERARELAMKQAELASIEKEIEARRKDAQALEKETERARRALDALDEAIASAREARDEARARVRKLREELADAEGELEKHEKLEAARTRERETTRAALAAEKTRAARGEARDAELAGEKRKLERAITALERSRS